MVTVVFVFFTVSAAKLATYLLPIFPPLALLTAVALREAFVREAPPRARTVGYRVAFHVLEALAVGLGVTAVVMGWLFWPDAILSGLVPLLLVVAIPMTLGHLLLRAQRPSLLVPNTLLLMVLLLFGFYGWFAPWLNDVFSLASPARLTRWLPPQRRVFTWIATGFAVVLCRDRAAQRHCRSSRAPRRSRRPRSSRRASDWRSSRSLLAVPAYVWWENPRVSCWW
jgi:hypothetical protein